MRRDRLSRRQFAALVWGLMVSPMLRQAPGPVARAAGRGAWLSALLALPAAGLLALAAGRFLGSRRPGEGLGELLCRALGRGWGRAAAALWAAWFVFYGGFVLRAGADRFVSAVYPDSRSWIFMAVMLALALPAGLGRLVTLGRCAVLTAPALGLVFVTVFLSCVPNLDGANLLPLAGRDVPGAAQGLGPLISVLAVGVQAGFLAGRTEPGSLTRPFAAAFLGQGALCLGLCVTTVGVFGPAMTGRMSYPFFVMIRSIRIPHLLERVEALVAALWVAADYLLLSALLHAASVAAELALRGPGADRRGAPVWICAGLMGLSGWACASTAFRLRDLGDALIPWGHALLAFGLLPGCLLLGRLRKK